MAIQPSLPPVAPSVKRESFSFGSFIETVKQLAIGFFRTIYAFYYRHEIALAQREIRILSAAAARLPEECRATCYGQIDEVAKKWLFLPQLQGFGSVDLDDLGNDRVVLFDYYANAMRVNYVRNWDGKIESLSLDPHLKEMIGNIANKKEVERSINQFVKESFNEIRERFGVQSIQARAWQDFLSHELLYKLFPDDKEGYAYFIHTLLTRWPYLKDLFPNETRYFLKIALDPNFDPLLESDQEFFSYVKSMRKAPQGSFAKFLAWFNVADARLLRHFDLDAERGHYFYAKETTARRFSFRPLEEHQALFEEFGWKPEGMLRGMSQGCQAIFTNRLLLSYPDFVVADASDESMPAYSLLQDGKGNFTQIVLTKQKAMDGDGEEQHMAFLGILITNFDGNKLQSGSVEEAITSAYCSPLIKLEHPEKSLRVNLEDFTKNLSGEAKKDLQRLLNLTATE